jgi:hypothetical protein
MTTIRYQVRIKNGEIIEKESNTIEGIVDYFLESEMDLWDFLVKYDIYVIECREDILSEFDFFVAVVRS